MENRSRRVPWFWLVAGGVVVAGVVGFVLYGPPLGASAAALNRWKGTGPDDRREAARVLIANDVLIGKTVEEVVRDLGPPDRSFEDRGEHEWQLAVEAKMGRDEKDRPQMQDETTYLAVRFTDGRATLAYYRAYYKPH